jgi:threonine dehydrogenase-like Zn-dependent dehydrogenase
MDRVVAYELELFGSHGLPAHAYPRMLRMISAGRLHPERLITRVVGLDEIAPALVTMDSSAGGVTVARVGA